MLGQEEPAGQEVQEMVVPREYVPLRHAMGDMLEKGHMLPAGHAVQLSQPARL